MSSGTLITYKEGVIYLNIIWWIFVWIVAVVVLVVLGVFILTAVGACLTYNHDCNQEKLAGEVLRDKTGVDLQLESYRKILKQKFQEVEAKEFISFYNDSDEMMDTIINHWAQKEQAVITDVKVFQTGNVNKITHFMIFYHKALTAEDIHDTLDKYTDDESKKFTNSL